MDKHSEISDIEDIMVRVLNIIEEYDSGQISRDQALKRALNVIEGLKSVDESMYQEIRNDLITTIIGK
jgi:hypothetical protein